MNVFPTPPFSFAATMAMPRDAMRDGVVIGCCDEGPTCILHPPPALTCSKGALEKAQTGMLVLQIKKEAGLFSSDGIIACWPYVNWRSFMQGLHCAIRACDEITVSIIPHSSQRKKPFWGKMAKECMYVHTPDSGWFMLLDQMSSHGGK